MDMSIIDISMKSNSPEIQLLESFGRLRRALNLHFTQILRPLGIGAKQAALIRLLDKQGTASLAELSRFTLTDPAATTRAVNVLLKRGLVRQAEHPTDKRRWQMALTPQGEKMAVKIHKVYGDIAQRVSGFLTPGERKELTGILLKLNQAFPAEGAKAQEPSGTERR